MKENNHEGWTCPPCDFCPHCSVTVTPDGEIMIRLESVQGLLHDLSNQMGDGGAREACMVIDASDRLGYIAKAINPDADVHITEPEKEPQ